MHLRWPTHRQLWRLGSGLSSDLISTNWGTRGRWEGLSSCHSAAGQPARQCMRLRSPFLSVHTAPCPPRVRPAAAGRRGVDVGLCGRSHQQLVLGVHNEDDVWRPAMQARRHVLLGAQAGHGGPGNSWNRGCCDNVWGGGGHAGPQSVLVALPSRSTIRRSRGGGRRNARSGCRAPGPTLTCARMPTPISTRMACSWTASSCCWRRAGLDSS